MWKRPVHQGSDLAKLAAQNLKPLRKAVIFTVESVRLLGYLLVRERLWFKS